MASMKIQRLHMIQPSLIDDIISILRDYPDNSQILKEIIQNAEDAGATVVDFILSDNGAGNSRAMGYDKYLKGPALCAFNDALFTDDDWRGIRMLRLSNKKDDPLKIGKFGLGFKSIFHLTDTICVISGNRILFIDPQEDQNDCTLVDLGDFNSEFEDSLSNINTMYGAKKIASADYLNGTIFWCPLRESSSRISDNIYAKAKVMDLFHSFTIEASMELLFLISLEKVTLFTTDAGKLQSFFCIKIANKSVDEVRSERTVFKTTLNELKKSLQENPSNILQMSPISITYTTIIETCKVEEIDVNTEQWLVIQYVHAGEMEDTLSSLIISSNNKVIPYVGLAIPFHRNLNYQGHVFCFLPLPLGFRSLTGLPVHVNGFFELSSDRCDLKWPTFDQKVNSSNNTKDVSWNQAVIGEIIPVVYTILLDRLAGICQNKQNNESLISVFWQAIPNSDTIETKWTPILKPVFQHLFENRLLFASNHSWVKGRDAIFPFYPSSNDSLPTVVTTYFKMCDQNLVELEDHTFFSIQRYVSPALKTTSPDQLRNLLKSNDIYKILNTKQKLQLLEFACSDHQYLEFYGIQLIPMADGTFEEFRPRSSSNSKIYLCDTETRELFPGMEYLFAVSDQLNEILKSLAETGVYQLLTLDHITAAHLLQAVIDSRKDIKNKTCVINPNDPRVGKRWLGNVWKYLSDNFSSSIGMVQHLYLLPIVSENKAKNISLCKIDELAMSSDNDFSIHLVDAMKLLGVKFVDDLIISAHHQMKPGRGFIEHPNPNGLVNLLEKMESKGEKFDLIDRFNQRCPYVAREQMKVFLSQSLNLQSGRGKNVIAKLKIFKETRFPLLDKHFSWESVDENKYVLEKSSYTIPLEFPFPVLIADNVIHCQLALCLGGKEMSILKVIYNIFDKILEDKNFYSLSEIRKFIKFVLANCKSWPEFATLRKKASDIKLVKNQNGEMKRANELFDPAEENLKQMFLLENKFPCEFDSDEDLLIFLRDIGLRKASDVEPHDIITTCDFIEKRQHFGSVNKNLLQKSEGLLRFLFMNPEILKRNIGKTTLAREISSKRCLPYLKRKPSTYPTFLPWYKDGECLCQPKYIRPFDEKNLIGSVMPVAPIDMPFEVLELFTETKDVLIANVIKHFNIIVQISNVEQCLSRTLQQMCLEIYSFFEQNMQTKQSRDIIKNALSGANVILTDHGFVHPSKVAFSLSIDCSPELFGLNNSAFAQNSTYLGEIGVKEYFLPCDIIQILQEIQKRRGQLKLKPKEISLIRNLTILLDDMELEEYHMLDIYLPDTNCILRNIKDLCVDDCKWISNSETMYFVHSDIHTAMAYKLGIKTKRDHNLLEVCDDEGIEFGQHEELLHRIERLLDGYPCDSGIMKEFLQNAEDAGATDLQFIIDCQCHQNERVFSENWKSIQGPALCIYNNSVFSEKDLKGIQRLGKGSKSEDLSQIGQYGVGFNSVYHITDVPSLLTKDPLNKETEKLCVFDPYCLYVPNATEHRPGRMFKNLDNLRRSYEDVFPCYLEDYWPEEKGTLFRLPLRTDEMARKIHQKYKDDKKSRKLMTMESVRELLTNFLKDMKESCLFLHNIKTVSVSEIDSNGSVKQLFTVEKSMTQKNEKKSLDFYKTLNSVRKNALDPFKLGCVCVDYCLTFKINKGEEESWLIVQTLGVTKEVGDLAKFADEGGKNFKYIPLGGVAHFIPNIGNQDAFNFKSFKSYCYLPLPKITGLPVHIHGHFVLGHEARRNVWWPDQSDKNQIWNRYLIENNIASSYVVAINLWKTQLWPYGSELKGTYEYLNLYHRIFPNFKYLNEDIWKQLAHSVYKQIYEKKSKLFPIVFHQEMQAFQYNRNQLRRNDTTFPVISNWVCVGVDEIFPAYFDNLNIQFIKDVRYDYYRDPSLYYVPAWISMKAMNLSAALKDLGLKLIQSPLWIYKTMRDLGFDVETVTKKVVVEFLKSFSMAEGYDRCKLQCVNVDVEETSFHSTSNVVMLWSYCSCESERELEGLPLLVTADMKLRAFSSKSPRYVSDFADLLPESPHLFVHKSLIAILEGIDTEKFQRFFKDFGIRDLATLLPNSLPEYMTGNIKLKWDIADKQQCMPKSWIGLFWKFLGYSLKEPTLKKRPLQEGQVSSNQEIYPVNQSQGFRGFNTRKIPETENERMKEFIDHVVSLLGDWNLFAALQKQRRIPPETLHYLIPIKESKMLLHMPYLGNKHLYSALSKLNLPQPDLVIINESYDATIKDIVLRLVTTPGNCADLLVCLIKNYNSFVSAKLTKTDCIEILGHFCRNLDDIKQHMGKPKLVKSLKSLPLYVTCDSSNKSLTDCSTVLAIPTNIPSDGIEDWAIQANITLLCHDPSLYELYSLIGCVLKKEWEVYSYYIFEQFHLLPDNFIISHMLFLRDDIIPSIKDEIEFETFCLSLKQLSFIPTKSGQRKRANKFYNLQNEVFRVMCDDLSSEELDVSWITFLRNKEWTEFLILAGMIDNVTHEHFIEFARKVEFEGEKNGTTEAVREKSLILLNYLKNNEERLSEINSTESDSVSRFLKDISVIRFIIPYVVPEEFSDLLPQNERAEKLLCFRGSVPSEIFKVVWSICSVLTTDADPNSWCYGSEENLNQIKSHLGFKDEPCLQTVVEHANYFHEVMTSGNMKHRLHNDCNLQILTNGIMDCLYAFFEKNRSNGTIQDTVLGMLFVYIPEKQVFVEPKHVILDISELDTIPPYLYKAPVHFGRYYELFKYLGVAETVTIDHYIGVLDDIHKLVQNEQLRPNEQSAVKKAAQGLFLTLQKRKGKSHIREETIYLPSNDNRLIANDLLVFIDYTHLIQRAGSHISDLHYFIGFTELEILNQDPISLIKLLPERNRPRMLSSILTETITVESKNTVVEDDEVFNLKSFLQSNEFLNGVLRLGNHNMQNSGSHLNEDQIEMIKCLLKTMQVFSVKVLISCINYKGQPVIGSEKDRQIMKEICQFESQSACCIYVRRPVENIGSIAQGISVIINECTGDLLGFCCIYVPDILACIGKSSDIEFILDNHYIRSLNIFERVFKPYQPELGTYLPVNLHHTLDTSITDFKVEEYVAVEEYDPDLNPNIDGQNNSPVYRIAQILERIDTQEANSIETVNVMPEYKIDIGNQNFQIVDATQIFKLVRHKDIEKLDVIQEKTVIQQHMRYAVRKSEQNRNRIIKRLILHYHSDNHEINKYEYEILFKFLLFLNEKLEENGSIDVYEVDNVHCVPSKTCYSKFVSNVIDRVLVQGINRQKYQSNEMGIICESRPQPEQTKRWLLQAKYDLTAAHNDMSTKNTSNWACYKCHQAVEKALKAMQYHKDANKVDLTTHCIHTLASTTENNELVDLVEKLGAVTGNHCRMRYPDAVSEDGNSIRLPATIYSAEDASAAYEYADMIIQIVEKITNVVVTLDVT